MMNKRNKKGFTLAELLIVVAIIAVLVAIAIPVFTSQLEKSRDAVTISNLRAAYAQAATDILTKQSSSTSGDLTSEQKVISKGIQPGFSDLEGQLPFTNYSSLATDLADLGNKPGEYTIVFTWAATTDADGSVTYPDNPAVSKKA